MNRTCIVVADAGRARFYGVAATNAPRVKTTLVEKTVLTNELDLRARGESVTGKVRTETNSDRGSGPVHPMAAQRERHRAELDRRFCADIVRELGHIVGDWNEGTVVLVAPPHMLGLIRENTRNSLRHEIELKELAKDYAHLGAAELRDRLDLDRIISERHSVQ